MTLIKRITNSKMKKVLLVILSSTVLLSYGCNTGEKNSESKTTQTGLHPVKPVTESVAAPTTGVINMTKADFLSKVMNYEKNPEQWVYLGDKPCIIDFYADWCRPCKIAAPILDELAKEYKNDIYVYKVNTEVEQELAAVFGIRSIPAFLICPKDGNPQMHAGIGQSNEETKAMFKSIIDEILLKKK